MVTLQHTYPIGHIKPSPDWQMSRHSHTFHETIVVLAGRLQVQFDDHERLATKGDVLLYAEGVAHREISDPDDPAELYFFSWTGDASELPECVSDISGRMRTLLAWIKHDQERQLQGDRALTTEYMRLFFREWHKAIVTADQQQSFVDDVIDYITANMHLPLNLDDLADVAGMSRYHFLRAYKKQRGCTPMQDLRRHRVDRAKRLLITTDTPLKDIPEQVGIANEYHLSRLFRKITGVPPGYFRKQYQHARTG